MARQTTYSREYIDGLFKILTERNFTQVGQNVTMWPVSGDGHSFDDQYEEQVEPIFRNNYVHSRKERRKAKRELEQLAYEGDKNVSLHASSVLRHAKSISRREILENPAVTFGIVYGAAAGLLALTVYLSKYIDS